MRCNASAFYSFIHLQMIVSYAGGCFLRGCAILAEDGRALTTWINLVFFVVCSLPQAKFPVSSRSALYLIFPPRALTSWIRFDESSLVIAA